MADPLKRLDLAYVSQWVALLCVVAYLVVEPSREGPRLLIATALPFSAIAVLLNGVRRHP